MTVWYYKATYRPITTPNWLHDKKGHVLCPDDFETAVKRISKWLGEEYRLVEVTRICEVEEILEKK